MENKRLRILFVGDTLDVSGVSTHSLLLAEGLKKRSHQLGVLYAGGRRLEHLQQHAAQHWTVPGLHAAGWRQLFTRRKYLREAASFKPHIIHAQSAAALAGARRMKRMLNVPLVVGVHRPAFGLVGLGTRPDAIIAVSESLRETLVNSCGVPKDLIHVVPNGIHAERFYVAALGGGSPEGGPPGGENRLPVILSMGRLEPCRGFTHFVRAAGLVKATGTHAQYVIIGDGPERAKLLRLAEAVGVRENLVLPGEVEDPRPALAGADIFVNPALEESFGLGVLEAMATGRPVITSGVGAAFSLVENEANGFIVNAGADQAMADRMCRLINDPEERLEMGLRGYDMARERFPADATVEKTLELYRTLARQRTEGQAIEKALKI